MSVVAANLEPLKAALVENPKPEWVFDVDSTKIGQETLDFCAKSVLCAAELKDFHAVTERGMSGQMGFYESFSSRVEVLKSKGVTKTQIEAVGHKLIEHIDPSALSRRDRIVAIQNRIFAVSGGVEDLIMPAMNVLGLKSGQVFANKFTYDKHGKLSGFEDRLTTLDDGKAQQVKTLGLKGFSVGVGDGYNDLLIRQAGLVKHFVAYVAHKQHEKVIAGADSIADSFAAPILS